MTRVNLVPPMCLYDQHLLAEYREIPRIPNAVRKSLKTKGSFTILESVPTSYRMGAGHVKFFYDKLQFIKNRHDALKQEGFRRGMNLSTITIDLEGIPEMFKKDFVPSRKDIKLNLTRILEKLNINPNFYRYGGKNID